jgi:hypothetical protein
MQATTSPPQLAIAGGTSTSEQPPQSGQSPPDTPSAQRRGIGDRFKTLVRRHLCKQREFILINVLEVQDLMRLIMKPRNSGQPWSRDEVGRIRAHIKTLVRLIPAFVVFLLPGGLVLLPVLSEVLDRRQGPRT